MTRALDRWEHASWAIPMLAGLATATLGAMAVDAAVQSPAAASWVYLLVVLPVALRWGRVVGVTTALLATVLLLTLLVEPRFSLTVADARDTSRVALSLGGMVGAAFLVQACAGHPGTGQRPTPQAHDPATMLPAVPHRRPSRGQRDRLGHTPERDTTSPPTSRPRAAGRERHPTGRSPFRPLRHVPGRAWPPAAGSLPQPQEGGAVPTTRTAGEVALPAWLCASLVGVLAGVLLAKYAQVWAQTTWHPAALWGVFIVVTSAALTVVAGTRYLVGNTAGPPPQGMGRLLGVLSVALVVAVAWGALAIILVAGWQWPPLRPH